ncbi:MAG: hypothetical protein AB1758_38160, partial [Candidatus Eremiobacterota bacterium]
VAARPARSRAETRALAERVAAELRELRQKAMGRGCPTALVVPTQGGTRGHAQAACVVEGFSQPVSGRVLDFSTEYPGVYLFAGHWDLDSGAAVPCPSLVPTKRGTFDLSQWSLPDPADVAFVYFPQGQLGSNGVEFDGACHLVACSGLDYQSTAQGFRLTRCSDPYTVVLGRAGEIRVVKGLPRAAGVISSPGALPLPPARPGPARPPNRDPEALGPVAVAPFPNPATLPPGIDATVRPDGYLNLTVHVVDPDGDPLWCHWTTRDGGGFSSSQQAPLRWDPEARVWSCVWEFHPPPGAVENAVYTLDYAVRDSRGGLLTGTLGAGGQVLIAGRDRLAFTNKAAVRTLTLCNTDGSGLVNLTPGAPFAWGLCWAPDGTRLLYKNSQGWPPPGGGWWGKNISTDLWVVHADGSGNQKLMDTRAAGYQALLNATYMEGGAQILATVLSPGGTIHIVQLNADGTHPENPSVRSPKRVLDTGLVEEPAGRASSPYRIAKLPTRPGYALGANGNFYLLD